MKHLVRPIRPWTDLRAIAELSAIIRDEKPDLVHTHTLKEPGIVGTACRCHHGDSDGVSTCTHMEFCRRRVADTKRDCDTGGALRGQARRSDDHGLAGESRISPEQACRTSGAAHYGLERNARFSPWRSARTERDTAYRDGGALCSIKKTLCDAAPGSRRDRSARRSVTFAGDSPLLCRDSKSLAAQLGIADRVSLSRHAGPIGSTSYWRGAAYSFSVLSSRRFADGAILE